MAEFKFKAKDPKGRIRTGKLKARSKEEVRKKLRQMRLLPVNVTATGLDATEEEKPFLGIHVYKDEKGRTQVQIGSKPPKPKEIMLFTKQLATMLSSGLPLLQCLDILADQQANFSFQRATKRIRLSVEQGNKLSDAMEVFPDIFDSLYVSMVRAGESSGNLDNILNKLISYIQRTEKVKSQIRSASLYPTIVIGVAILVITILLVFVVPEFAKQYEGANRELPELTKIVIEWSRWLTNNWAYLLGYIVFAFFIFKSWRASPPGRRTSDGWLLNLPLVGVLLSKIAVGRFCSTMSTMLNSGVNILEALSICSKVSNNMVIEEFVKKVKRRIEEGDKFSTPLSKGKLFPRMVVSMIAVGESSGALDDMLEKISEFYDEEVDVAIKNMISAIEPIMIVVIGGIVLFILVAMYLPIFDLANIIDSN